MQYQIVPVGSIWQDGMVAVPKKAVSDYIKLASEYQLKALLLILANNGPCDGKFVAKSLGCTEADANDFLEFWVEEGVLSCDGAVNAAPVSETAVVQPKLVEVKTVEVKETIPVPTLNPSDIVAMCRENKELTELIQHAQEVFGRTISHVEQELVINMATYYGLPSDVILVILQYYKTEKSKGRAIGTGYIGSMAKKWSEEGIVTLEAADEKLRMLESSDRLWSEIVAVSGIKHRNPTVKQREMINRWSEDFDIQMISIACDIMKENTDKPTLKYVDSVLKNWKKKGIFTPEAVAEEEKEFHAKKEQKSKSAIDETYDIDEINRRAMLNDDYDI